MPSLKDTVQIHVPHSFAILCNSMRLIFSPKQFKGTCFIYIWRNHAICSDFNSYIMPYKLSDIMFISMKHIYSRNSWNHCTMNCLYANHIHKDYFVYHAFMHIVKSSCHASLAEQSGLLRLQEHPIVQPRVSAWRSKFVVSRISLRCFEFLYNKVEVMYRFK